MKLSEYTKAQAREDFLCGIITSCVEGGSLNFEFRRYKWETLIPGDMLSPLVNTSVEAKDGEYGESPKDWTKVTTKDIAAALVKFKAPDASDTLGIHNSYVNIINGANRTNDGGMLDGETADMVLQVALNGRVIFG